MLALCGAEASGNGALGLKCEPIDIERLYPHDLLEPGDCAA
jgi:hypothetical protein